jgi:hypothetical protein
MEKRNIYGRFIEELIIIKLIINNDINDYLNADRVVKGLKETKHCFQISLEKKIKDSMEVCCDALFGKRPEIDKDELARIKNFSRGKHFINDNDYFGIIDQADFQKLSAIPQVPIQTFEESCKRTKDLAPEQRYIVRGCESIFQITEVIAKGAFAVIISAEMLQNEETKLNLIMEGLKEVVTNSFEEFLKKMKDADAELKAESQEDTWKFNVPPSNDILYKS